MSKIEGFQVTNEVSIVSAVIESTELVDGVVKVVPLYFVEGQGTIDSLI